MGSMYHVELNPSDAGNYDRYVVQEIIKEMARNRPLDRKMGFKVCMCGVGVCSQHLVCV